MKRNIYLKTVSLQEALAIIDGRDRVKREPIWVKVAEALGMQTAQAVYANVSNPNHNAAAMDGIAVVSSSTLGASETNAVHLDLGRDFIWVNTGHVVKKPYDAVIMVEDLEPDQDGQGVRIRSAAYTWQHVRMVGEDIAVGDMIMPKGRKIGPFELGAMASAGVTEVLCQGPVVVGLIPTGSEIVTQVEEMGQGGILESNSLMFAGLIAEAGGRAIRYPIVKDVQADLEAMVKSAVLECDVVVINAGSSAGSEDYTRAVLESLGHLHFHGIDIKPGKPSLFATVSGVPVFGIPGYPVSAYVAFDALVMPLVRAQLQQEASQATSALLTRPLMSSLKHEEFVRVQVGTVDGRVVATPLARGAGATMSLVKANGMVRVPRSVEGYPAGTQVEVWPLNTSKPLVNALIAIGSHDLVMDVIDDLTLDWNLMSSHVGSLGGIMALKRNEAHLAPIHLLNENEEGYNTEIVQRYFPDEEMALIKGIKRISGLYTREPLETKGFRGGILCGSFVNRQKGSGTRVLTDYLLAKEGLKGDDIPGYPLEMLTHTAVAQAVKVGSADVGMGIESVARRMGLHFEPICQEDYDFLVKASQLDNPLIQNFIDLLQSRDFERALDQLGGYVLEPISVVLCGGKGGMR